MTHDLTVCPRVTTNVKSLSKHCLNRRFYKNPIEKLLQMMLIHYSVNFTVAGHFFFCPRRPAHSVFTWMLQGKSAYLLCSCLNLLWLQTSSLLALGFNAPAFLLTCRNIINLHVLHMEGRAALAGLEDMLPCSVPGVTVQSCFTSNTNQIPLKSWYLSHPI